MVAKQISIDGNAINGITSFYEEVNRVFMAEESWRIGQSLDAFDDLLYGGYGSLKGTQSVDLVWHNMDHSRNALGYQATRAYYLDKLKPGSPYNKKLFSEKLKALEAGAGETYFDIIMSILAEHPSIRVITTGRGLYFRNL